MTPFHDELAASYRAARKRLSPRPPQPLPVMLTTPKAIMESAAYIGTKGRANAILDEVAAKHNISVRDIISTFREKHLAAARAEACWRMRTEITVHGLPMSYPMIGRALRLDHSTAVYHVQRWRARLAA